MTPSLIDKYLADQLYKTGLQNKITTLFHFMYTRLVICQHSPSNEKKKAKSKNLPRWMVTTSYECYPPSFKRYLLYSLKIKTSQTRHDYSKYPCC